MHLIMIKGAAEEILEAQYCSNGNHEDWLVRCATKKLRALRVMAVTSDEFQALIAKNWGLINRGGSDGLF